MEQSRGLSTRHETKKQKCCHRPSRVLASLGPIPGRPGSALPSSTRLGHVRFRRGGWCRHSGAAPSLDTPHCSPASGARSMSCGSPPWRRKGVSYLSGSTRCQRVSVSACRRVGVSACRRVETTYTSPQALWSSLSLSLALSLQCASQRHRNPVSWTMISPPAVAT